MIIRQVGGGSEALHHGGAHIVGFDGYAAHHIGVNPQRVDKRVGGVEQGFFVFLIVFVVRQGLGFHQGNQTDKVSDDGRICRARVRARRGFSSAA